MSTETLEPVAKSADLPEPVVRRGVSEAQWRTLCNSLFPGANPQSVLLVIDYCQARKLDPMKKPCHIVPMRVKDGKTGEYGWRDVVMPGIYEYRTTAQRTGEYLGHSRPEYGPVIEHAGVKAPEWCEMTMYRHCRHGERIEFPVRRYFAEVVGVTKEGKANDRWSKAPVQMLEKCVEAAGLREAFPDEFGGEPTAEEMDDQRPIEIDTIQVVAPPQPGQRKSQQLATTEPPTTPAAPADPPSPRAEPKGEHGAAPQAQPSALPSNIGTVVDVVPLANGASGVRLSTGFYAATKDEAIIRGAQMAKEAGLRVELVVRPAKDPTKFAPTLLEVKVPS